MLVVKERSFWIIMGIDGEDAPMFRERSFWITMDIDRKSVPVQFFWKFVYDYAERNKCYTTHNPINESIFKS